MRNYTDLQKTSNNYGKSGELYRFIHHHFGGYFAKDLKFERYK